MGTIRNASDIPLNIRQGTVPDVSGAILDWFQAMTFTVIAKSISAFQVVETPTVVNFRGVIQPLSGRQIMMKPEGQREWDWLLLYSDTALQLNIDDVVTYIGVQYRVMAKKDFSLYGYMDYHIVEDYTGAGP